MPDIFTYFGFIFSFYSNPLSSKDDKTARLFIEKYWQNIIDKWVNFFVYKKRVRCTDIKTKL